MSPQDEFRRDMRYYAYAATLFTRATHYYYYDAMRY